MINLEKYTKAFATAFGMEPEKVTELTHDGTTEWDSVGHMALIAELEEAFDIMLEPNDVIEIMSFEKGKEILKKYDVEF